MSWRIVFHHPDRDTETRHFTWPREAWAEFHELVRALEADGFVAGELETIRYGAAWVQHLTRGSSRCRLEMLADQPA